MSSPSPPRLERRRCSLLSADDPLTPGDHVGNQDANNAQSTSNATNKRVRLEREREFLPWPHCSTWPVHVPSMRGSHPRVDGVQDNRIGVNI
jgi:hypothetical protein